MDDEAISSLCSLFSKVNDHHIFEGSASDFPRRLWIIFVLDDGELVSMMMAMTRQSHLFQYLPIQ